MATQQKKSKGASFSSLNSMLIIQLIILIGLSVFITVTVSKRTRENSLQHMGAISDERAHLIENYVTQSENTLKAFSKAKQVTDLLQYSTEELDKLSAGDRSNAEAAAALDAAQQFTEKFGEDIEALEGLWIGSWDTHVMTHTNSALVGIGMQTRKDAAKQDELHKGMQDGEKGLFNTGIIVSPASIQVGNPKQCLSLYQAVYDKSGNPIGFVGLGIYTEKLVEKLDTIPIRGIEHSSYSMVNTANTNFIFNGENDVFYLDGDNTLVPISTENPDLLKLCEELHGTTEEKSGSYEYKKDGKKYVSIYSYMHIPNGKNNNNDWILTIDDEQSEVFALTRTMRFYLGIFIVFIVILIIIFNIINKRHEIVNQKLVSTLAKNTMTKKSLNTAMYQDVLTGAGNRIRFATEIEKAEGEPHFFALFNICDFSDINIRYGNDLGDLLLVRTVDILKELYPDAEIYRTGSDEFIVMQKAGPEGMNRDEMLSITNNALRRLLVPEKTEDNQKIFPTYKISVIKKSEHLDSTIISQLKEITNKNGEAEYGMLNYKDMS